MGTPAHWSLYQGPATPPARRPRGGGRVFLSRLEIQGTAERRPFTEERLAQLLTLARTGLKELISLQNEVLESQLADIDLQA